MGLADRIVHRDGNTQLGDIPIHEFTSALTLFATGDATHAQIVNIFSLQPDEESGLTTLEDALSALPDQAAKSVWIAKLEAAGIFYQNGAIDKAKYMQIMGL